MSSPEPPTAGGGDDVAWFVQKWRGAWPEWAVAEVFLPAHVRPLADAWQALQFELTEAAWANEDPRPGQAKLGWWMEELHGWTRGMRRHPLATILQRTGAPWSALGAALPALAAARERPSDAAAAWSALHPAASAASDVERALFPAPDPSPDGARLVTACWLHARLARHPERAAPLDLHALGPEQARERWRQDLQAAWPTAAGAAAPRRLEAALALGRLRRGDASRPLGAWPALWTGWRAARD